MEDVEVKQRLIEASKEIDEWIKKMNFDRQMMARNGFEIVLDKFSDVIKHSEAGYWNTDESTAETPLEAIEELEVFLIADFDGTYARDWDETFLKRHFKICKDEVKRIENEKQKLNKGVNTKINKEKVKKC